MVSLCPNAGSYETDGNEQETAQIPISNSNHTMQRGMRQCNLVRSKASAVSPALALMVLETPARNHMHQERCLIDTGSQGERRLTVPTGIALLFCQETLAHPLQ